MSRAKAASLSAAQRRRLMLRSARNSAAAPHTTLFTCAALPFQGAHNTISRGRNHTCQTQDMHLTSASIG